MEVIRPFPLMDSRNTKDMETLVELIIADKLKYSMPYSVYDFCD